MSERPTTDPLKSFRGVMAGTLVIEAIVVALALPVVAKLGGGIGSVQGWSLLVVVVALVMCGGLLRHSWTPSVVLILQVALIAFFITLPSVGIVGVLFLGVWLYLLWLRRDVARRMAEGRLPSQQEQ
ncbi:MAG: DUF4233 domain-containing protein [Haloechinothrix sp.]